MGWFLLGAIVGGFQAWVLQERPLVKGYPVVSVFLSALVGGAFYGSLFWLAFRMLGLAY
jgi:hypothetical protein